MTALWRSGSLLRQLWRCGVLAAAVFCTALPAGATEWEPVKSLSTGAYTPVFLATTPEGDVVATTFNASGTDKQVDLPVILIRNPLSESPGLFAVCTNRFPAGRGYSGVAVDKDGNFYVAADAGQSAGSWIRKFDRSGNLVREFGQGGEISDGSRYLGLAVLGNHLLTTAAWGELRSYDTRTGQLVGKAPKGGGTPPYIRDIAVDPSRRAVFGVAEGAVWVWEGGSPENPANYRLRSLTERLSKPVSGEGVTFDPWSRKALFAFQPTRSLMSVDSSGHVEKSPVIGPQTQDARVADSVLLADGRTLFVSDLQGNAIHVMRRRADLENTLVDNSVEIPSPAAGSAARGRLEPPAGSGGSQWLSSYEDALRQAEQQQKPLLVYFRTDAARGAVDFERTFLASPDFQRVAPSFVKVKLNADQERLLSQQLGVFKVPYLAIFSPTGDRLAAFSGNIDVRQLMEQLSRAGGGL